MITNGIAAVSKQLKDEQREDNGRIKNYLDNFFESVIIPSLTVEMRRILYSQGFSASFIQQKCSYILLLFL